MMRGRLRAARCEADDSGFGVLEVVVALVVLAIVGAGAASMLLSSLRSTSNDRSRVAAANLALREIEMVRAAFLSPTLGPRSIALGEVVNPDPLSGGIAGQPIVVDSRAYTIKRTAEWQAQGATAGPCDGGSSGQLAYLRVSVKVTWPDMGGTTPVTSSTLLTPPLGTYNAGTGHIKVKVLDQNNAPEEGTTVTLLNSVGGALTSQLTASDGCAFFAFLDPGTFSVQLSRTGYVDNKWQPTPTTNLTVVANAVTSYGFSYAPATSIVFSITSPVPGYTPPTATALTIYNNALTSSTHTSSFPASAPIKTLSIWPYSDGVISWSGDCADADPGSYGNYRAAPTDTVSGATSTATATGVPVSITVLKGSTAQPSLTVEAVHANSGCPTPVKDPYDNSTTVGEVLTFPLTTDSAGNAKVLLPYGGWTLKVLTKNPSGSWPTLNLTPTTVTPVVQNVVVQ